MNKIWNKKVFNISFIIWAILHITKLSDFYSEGMSFWHLVFIKFFHLVFLYFIFLNIYYLFKDLKTESGKLQWKYFWIYMIIFSILFAVFYPGLWSYDDVDILNGAYRLDFVAWQHFFSGLYYIVCLQTIPIPSAVIFIQLLIIALVMSRALLMLKEIYRKNIVVVMTIIITLLPPLILYEFAAWRMSVYMFFELFLLIKLLYIFKKNVKLELSSLIEFCFYLYIVSTLRTEGIYYPVIVILILLIFCKKILSRKTALISISIVFVLTLVTMKYNNYLIGNNRYSLTATINTASYLVKNADKADQEEINKINKVLNVDYILSNPEMNGEDYFWSNQSIRDYSLDNYNDYIRAVIKLSLKYPDKAFECMWEIFYAGGSGQGNNNKQTTYNMILGTLFLFDENYPSKVWNPDAEKYKVPLMQNVREKTALFLGGTDWEHNLTIIHKVFWNYIIPIGLLLISFIIWICRREWFMASLIVLILIRIPLLFVTSPAPYFMYYLSVYLCGYVFSFITIYETFFCSDRIKKNKYIIKMKNSKLLNQFIKFILASGIGWCMDFSVYLLLTSALHFSVLLSNIVSAIPAITYVFLMSNKKIFKNKKSKYSLKEKYLIYFGYQLLLLLMVSSIGELLYRLLSSTLTATFIFDYLKIIIKIIITPITMTMNFIVMRKLIERL